MKLKIQAGTTSRIARIFVQDSTKTDGSGLTGLTSGSSGLTWYFSRVGDTGSTSITLAAGTLGTYTNSGGAGTGGGFVAVDATHMPGIYEISIPNAALASGSNTVHMVLRGAANMVPVPVEIELDAVNYQSQNGFITGVNSLAPPTNWNLLSIAASTGQVGVDLTNIKQATSPTTLTNITIPTITSITNIVTANLTEVAGSAIPTPNTAGVLIVDVGYVDGTAATPSTASLASGTAQAGGSSTITLAAADTKATGLYPGNLITLLTGPGAGQSRTIISNVLTGSNNVCTVDYAWVTQPTSSTTYQINPADGPSVNSSLQVATTASDPWGTALPGSYGAGTAGNIVGSAIPASILTRSTYSGADTSGTTTLLTRLSGNLTISSGKVAATLATGDVSGNLPANIVQIASQTASAAGAVTFPASIGTSTYAGGTVSGVTATVNATLVASGLDAISVADPGTPGNWTTFPKILVAMFRKFLKKSDMVKTGSGTATEHLYADDGSTVNASQSLSDDGTTQTQGTAS